jgi:hypothetical protein
MHLEIQDVQIRGSKLVFKLEYDEEFRLEVGRIQNKPSPSKKDVQNYILEVIDKSLDLESLGELSD